jgi:transcriptional regulator with XRE-family HTH domain
MRSMVDLVVMEIEMLKDIFKKLREKAGLSQQEVATKAGLSWSLVAQIEQGKKSDVRVSTLLGLARALGVDAGVMLAAFAEGFANVAEVETEVNLGAVTDKPKKKAETKAKAQGKKNDTAKRPTV